MVRKPCIGDNVQVNLLYQLTDVVEYDLTYHDRFFENKRLFILFCHENVRRMSFTHSFSILQNLHRMSAMFALEVRNRM